MLLEDIQELADFYDCVDDDDDEPREHAGTIAAMAYVQDENDALTNHQLENQRFQQLGIDINDGTLHSRAVNVNALDLSSRLAHAHWKELYNFSEHK
jgi:hypothetical protein